MHLYLTRWAQGTDGATYPRGCFGASSYNQRVQSYSSQDLRPDLTRPEGFCLLFTRERHDVALSESVYLGDEGDWDSRSVVVKQTIESTLRTTMDASDPTTRTLLKEVLLTKTHNLHAGASGFLCKPFGREVFRVPVIQGGAGPFTDDATAADGTEVNARAWSGGTETWVADNDNEFDINTNRIAIEATTTYYGAWGTPALDTAAHYVKSTAFSVTDAADLNNWGGILLRGDGSAVTMKYTGIALRPAGDIIYLITMNPGIGIPTSDAWVHGTQTDVALHGYVDASHNYILNVAGTQRFADNYSAINSTEKHAGIFGRNPSARTTYWADVEIGDGDGTGAAPSAFATIVGTRFSLAGPRGLAG